MQYVLLPICKEQKANGFDTVSHMKFYCSLPSLLPSLTKHWQTSFVHHPVSQPRCGLVSDVIGANDLCTRLGTGRVRVIKAKTQKKFVSICGGGSGEFPKQLTCANDGTSKFLDPKSSFKLVHMWKNLE